MYNTNFNHRLGVILHRRTPHQGTRNITVRREESVVFVPGVPSHLTNLIQMRPSEIDGILKFLRAAESMKIETRTAWTSDGAPESVASHTWRLCLWDLCSPIGFPKLIPSGC